MNAKYRINDKLILDTLVQDKAAPGVTHCLVRSLPYTIFGKDYDEVENEWFYVLTSESISYPFSFTIRESQISNKAIISTLSATPRIITSEQVKAM